MAQIFDKNFEQAWAEFDRQFRHELLVEAQALGSLYRLEISNTELLKAFGSRFYDALYRTIDMGLLDKVKACLAMPLPKEFDDVLSAMTENQVNPFHSFVLLLIFVQQNPIRAFFSGRDEELPYNTLTVRVQQAPTDALPRSVSYSLSKVDLATATCDNVAPASQSSPKPRALTASHPNNHFFWQNTPEEWGIYTWHFELPPPF